MSQIWFLIMSASAVNSRNALMMRKMIKPLIVFLISGWLRSHTEKLGRSSDVQLVI